MQEYGQTSPEAIDVIKVSEFESLMRLADEMAQRIRDITRVADDVSERLFGAFTRVGDESADVEVEGQIPRTKASMQKLHDDISDLQTAVERLTGL